MNRASVALLLLLAPSLAAAQAGQADFDRALGAFNAKNYAAAAPTFFQIAEGGEPAVRAKGEYFLGQSYFQLGLPASAFIQYAVVAKQGPQHPHFLQAVEGLVDIQASLDEQNLIPNLLAQLHGAEPKPDWSGLPPEVRARVDYLVATILQRRGKYEEARALLEGVPRQSRVWAKARYLLGVVLADPRFPGRPGAADTLDAAAKDAFASVMELNDRRQADLDEVRQLAILGLGRLHYGRGEYRDAVKAYERMPRRTRYWDQALFENGFARFQSEDFGGALGSLQALHAPQFAGAFQPESWILKATVYYFACLFEESKAALQAFDELYGPMIQQLAPLLAEDPQVAFNLVSAPDTKRLPRPVYLWARNNERVRGVIRLLGQIDREKRRIQEDTPAWRGTPLLAASVAALEDNRNTLLQIGGALAQARLKEAHDNLRTFGGQAEIIRVQTALDEKDLYEQGVDQQTLLAKQSLHRPKRPAEDWDYWKFQGEFWIDEIGYYQYTLKRGCPARAEQGAGDTQRAPAGQPPPAQSPDDAEDAEEGDDAATVPQAPPPGG